MASSPSRKSDVMVGAHDSSHFFLFLSGTQSKFLSESEDGRGGTKCAQKKKKVWNSPLGKWEKERTRENSMIIWQHERASLDPVVMNSKWEQWARVCVFLQPRSTVESALIQSLRKAMEGVRGK